MMLWGCNLMAQTGLVALLMTSSPLLLLVLPPTVHSRISFPSSEPRCEFPDYLQTKRHKLWMMNQSNAVTTFTVDGGKLFARHAYGSCVSSPDYTSRRRGQSGLADCTKSNYTRVCVEKRPGDKYLVRHVESDFDDKFVCLQFLPRGVSVVQVKMSLIQGARFVTHLCDDGYMHVDPWPWVSEERYRSAPVRCPFSGGFNLQLLYASPSAASNQGYYGSSYYGGSSYYAPHTPSVDNGGQDCVDTTTAPFRMESDCVTGEGIRFHFKHPSCLPAGSSVQLDQRALCMAAWRSGRQLFSMLRAHNDDRAFFCLRVTLSDREDRGPREMRYHVERDTVKIEEVTLFLGWVCPTSSHADSSSRAAGFGVASGGGSVNPLQTPHMVFSVQERQVITDPCSDQLGLCHKHRSFCQARLLCMRTCGECVAAPGEDALKAESASSTHSGGYHHMSESESAMSKKATVMREEWFSVRYSKNWNQPQGRGASDDDSRHWTHRAGPHPPGHRPSWAPAHHTQKRDCTFPPSMRGTWLRRTSAGSDERMVITENVLDHPDLGQLECVTFSEPEASSTPLQRVLWSRFGNGCYPRFTCLQFNTPAKSVMRFRLANQQVWPLALSDSSICDQSHFMEPPDMYQPEDRYKQRSWEVVRRSGHIHRVACILPIHVPRVVSFLDDRGRSGCLVHGTYYSSRDLTLTFFPQKKSGKSAPARTSTGSRDAAYTGRDVTSKKTDTSRNGAASGEKLPTRKPGSRYPDDPVGRRQNYDGGDDLLSHTGYRQAYTPGSGLRDDWRNSNQGRLNENWQYEENPKPPSNTRGFLRSRNDDARDRDFTNRGGGGNDRLSEEDFNYATHSDSHRGLFEGLQQTPQRNRHHRRNQHNRRNHHRHSLSSYHPTHPDDGRFRRSSSVKASYQCLAVMTYIDSYKSLLTTTTGNDDEVLCWLVVNASTIVVLKTSSCNSQEADRVLASPAHSAAHSEHVHMILYLHRGERDCDAMFPSDPVRPQPFEFRYEDSAGTCVCTGLQIGLRLLLSVFVLPVVKSLLLR